MSVEPTPPLSREGWDEVVEEMSRPPADTPERRATFEQSRIMEEVIRRSRTLAREAPKKR